MVPPELPLARGDEVVDDVGAAGTAGELDQPARDYTFLGVFCVRIRLRQDALGQQIGGKQPRDAATGEPAAQQVGGRPQAGQAGGGPGEAGECERLQIGAGVEPGPSYCGIVQAAALAHADLPGVVGIAPADKSFTRPERLDPHATGETLPTKASQAAYRAKPSASGWIGSPKT